MRVRRILVGALATAAVVQVLVLLGLPLAGVRTFTPTDILSLHAPWRQEAPAAEPVWSPLFTDVVDAVLPARESFVERARRGDLATWDPYPAGGTALGAVPDASLLSPLTLPYLVLPTWYAPAVAKLAELVVSAGGMLLFLRRRGLSRPAAALAGMAYASSGFLVVWTHWPHPTVAAFVPALFWTVERWLQERDGISAGLVAAVVAAMALGGFPAVTAYAAVAVGVYALLRLRALPRARTLGLVGLVAAGLLGLGLVAFQLLPFAARLDALDLAYRSAPGAHLPARLLLTLVIPNAYGTSAGGVYFGWGNYAEAQSFVGAAVVALALVAIAQRPVAAAASGLRGYLAGLAGVTIAVTYFDTVLLRAVQAVPLLGSNFIGRTRPLLAFALTGLAALGVDVLLARRPAGGGALTRALRWLLWAAAVVALLAGLWRMRQDAMAVHVPWDRGWTLVGLVAVALAGAAVLVARRWPSTGPTMVVVLAIVAAVEQVSFSATYLPRPDVSAWYPDTTAHELLRERLDGDRVASAGTALYPGTNGVYGIRSVGGHTFHQPTYAALVSAADPEAFRARPGVSRLSASPHVATSPVLDRLSARYWAVAPGHLPYGPLETVTAPAPTASAVVLGDGDSVTLALPPGPLRGLVLLVAEPSVVASPPAIVTVRLLDADGEVVARSERHLAYEVRRGPLALPLAAEAVPDGSLRAEVSLAAEDGWTLPLTSGADGTPALRRVLPADDGLRLVHADGVVLYERTTALPRVRWAAAAEVVADPRERLRRLRSGVAPDTVLLDAEGPAATGAPASVAVVADTGDEVRARVRADGAGYLVVADAVQHGWRAELDGEPAALHRADHAFVAVAVPAGEHEVTLRHEPPGWVAGGRVSLASAGLLAVLVAVGLLQRRRRRAQPEQPGPQLMTKPSSVASTLIVSPSSTRPSSSASATLSSRSRRSTRLSGRAPYTGS